MIKTNKLVALGLLAAVGANFVLAPAASAAGNGATNFVYAPGTVSGGGDGSDSNGNGGDGSNAKWTVSYPVQTNIADGNTQGNGAALKFEVKATSGGDLSAALGTKVINITPGSNTVNLQTSGNSPKTVTLQLASGDSAAAAKDLSGTTPIATLSTSKSTVNGWAYLKDVSENPVAGETYSGKVTWDIVQADA